MKTSIVEVGGMLSALSAYGVEKQLARLPGVKRAAVNHVTGNASVEYDETVTDMKRIKSVIRECGYHCAGEMLPKHVCMPEDLPPAVALHVDHVELLPAGRDQARTLNPMAGKLVRPAMLVNVPELVTAYYAAVPDASVAGQRVAFGTSGHRGSAFKLGSLGRIICAASWRRRKRLSAMPLRRVPLRSGPKEGSHEQANWCRSVARKGGT